MAQPNYKVFFHKYTERHYIKTFEKLYKSKWPPTLDYLNFACSHIEDVLKTDRADLITTCGPHRIVKLDFAIFGLRVSPKRAGNRCILYINSDAKQVEVLLVYSKKNLPPHNETENWKKIIRSEYPAITQLVKL